jgi:hypothetical protein
LLGQFQSVVLPGVPPFQVAVLWAWIFRLISEKRAMIAIDFFISFEFDFFNLI